MMPVSVTLAEVFDAVVRRRTTLAPETAGYLVLGLADQLVHAPRAIEPRLCGIVVEGGTVVLNPAAAAPAADVERTLRRLLLSLLRIASGNAPALGTVASLPPRGELGGFVAELESALVPLNRGAAKRALSRLARDALRARGDGAPSDGEILIDLEQAPEPGQRSPGPPALEPEPRSPAPPDALPFDLPALSPTERIAVATRARPATERTPLPHAVVPAFLEQEPVTAKTPPPTEFIEQRAATPSDVPAEPRRESLAEVDQLLAAAGETPFQSSPPGASSRGVEELLAQFSASESRQDSHLSRDLRRMADLEATPMPAGMPPTVRERRAATPSSDPSFEDAKDLDTSTPPPRASSPLSPAAGTRASATFESVAPRGAPKRGVYVLAALLVVLAVGAVLLWRAQAGWLSGRTEEVVEAERKSQAAAAESAAAHASAASCRATIVVDELPPMAEVLVRAGIAPVDVERLPTGARLEFVALGDGLAPRRSVIPAGAVWEKTNGKPRFELAIQLEKTRAKPSALDPWPAAEPGSTVGGQGPPGTVHVVTTPRGAEVWMVAGMGPEAKLESLPCAVAVELMVVGAAGGQPYRHRLRVDAAQLTPEGAARAVTAHVNGRPTSGN
jgi:hypothetical protein